MAMLFGKKQKKTAPTPLSASMGSSASAPVVSGPIFHSSGSSGNVSEPEREHNYTRNYEVKTEALKIALQNSVHQTLSLREQIKGLNNTLDDEVQQRKRAEAEVDELQQMLDVLKSRVRGLERQFQDEKASQQKLLSAPSSSPSSPSSSSSSVTADSKSTPNNPASIDLLRHTLISNSQGSSSPSGPASPSSSPSTSSSSLNGLPARNERPAPPSGTTQTDKKPSLVSTGSGSGLSPSAAAASLRKRPPVKSAILNTPTIRNRRPEDEVGSPSSSPSSSSSNLNSSPLSHQSSSSLLAPAPSSPRGVHEAGAVQSDQPEPPPRSMGARPPPPQRKVGERVGPGGQGQREQEVPKSPIDKLAQRQANRVTVEVSPQSAPKKHFPPPPSVAPPEHLQNKRITPPSDPSMSSGSLSSLPPPPSRGPSPLRAPVQPGTALPPSSLSSETPVAPPRRPLPPTRTLPPRPPTG